MLLAPGPHSPDDFWIEIFIIRSTVNARNKVPYTGRGWVVWVAELIPKAIRNQGDKITVGDTSLSVNFRVTLKGEYAITQGKC